MTLHSYLTRLIWWCVAPVLALAVGLGYLQFSQARDDDVVHARQLARTLAAEVDQTLGARLAGLQTLSLSPLLDRESRWADFYRVAQGFRSGFGGHVILVSPDLRTRLHTDARLGDALPPLPRPTGRAAVTLALESARPAVGDPFDGPLAREALVAIAAPVVREERVELVLVNTMPVRLLEPLLTQQALPADWVVALYDSRDEVIVHHGGQLQDVRADGADRMWRFQDRPSVVPWSVEVRMPRTTYAQHLWSVASMLALALLAVTLIAVTGGQWAARRLTREVSSLAQPGLTAQGEIEEVRAVRRLLDATLAQREAATEALQLREEQLRSIFASASDAIVTADASQTIVLANPAAAAVFGRPVEQLVGAPLDSLIPERLRRQHHDDVERFGRDEGSARPMGRRTDMVGLRADGQEFPIEAAISQVHVAGQRLYTVILRDVTERRRTESAIAAGKARLEATIESMDDGLLMADTEGSVVAVNLAFVRLYGFRDRSECMRTLEEFHQLLELRTLDGRVLEPAQWMMPRALRGESRSGVELRVTRRDTGQSWIGSFSFAPIRDAEGRIIGAVFTVRDITRDKQLQAELEASHADLERLVNAQQRVQEEERKRIAGELHDDLQQVLAAIKIDVGSIESELAADPARLPPLVARIDELATAAITSSRRIVDDLRPLLLEELGLAPALQALCRKFSQRTGIDAQFECDERCHEPDEVPEAIAVCLYRVAQESLNNAAKHSRARRVRVQLASPAPGRWSMRIADDGRGLQPQDLRKPMSFGLRGMAERVRAFGGTLRVDGGSGSGVTIEVQIGSAEPTQGATT